MQEYQGKKIFGGIAIGRIRIEGKSKQTIKRNRITDIEKELKRYHEAVKEAGRQLKDIYDKAVEQVGEVNAQIFMVHQMMLEDDDYTESVENIIRNQEMNAEYAVGATCDNFVKMFGEMEDEYFRARADDIKDVSDRLLTVLSGECAVEENSDEPFILAADELTPSETIQIDRSKLLGFVTKYGSVNSHTAILARTMNIPAITDIDVKTVWNGKTVIIDGYAGKLFVEPEDAVKKEYEKKLWQINQEKQEMELLKGKENVTRSGRKIKLYSNIANVADVYEVLHNDSEGIGLFRSEFLYMEQDMLPDEEKQFAAYRQVAENMGGKKVIIRTMDIGADKKLPYLNLAKEENPALGYRAIRIGLDRRDILKTQLRSIYRAGLYGNISVMYPMITSEWELDEILQVEKEVEAQLRETGIECKKIERGIMIETPAAAVISDLLAKKVDFFSIGTNDLVQYTLAVDRQNSNLNRFYDPHHDAVMRLIQNVIDNGHRENIWVGICGEMASDTAFTDELIDMGIDELSVAPVFNLAIRKKIREHQ